MKTYVLVSQGIKIDETSEKDLAIEIANKENKKWVDYIESVEEYESYANNEVLVYEVIDGDEENSKLIWRAFGEVKEN